MITHVFSINIELHKWNSPLKGVVWSNLLHAIALCYKLHSKRGVFTPILWIIDEISFWRTHKIVGLNRNHCFSCDLCENRVCTIDKHWLIVRIRVKKKWIICIQHSIKSYSIHLRRTEITHGNLCQSNFSPSLKATVICHFIHFQVDKLQITN